MTQTPPCLSRDTALFLDFDGTLVEFARVPRAVTLAPDLVPILTGVRDRLGGALAIVTGREIANITEMFAPLDLPVAGSHGAERRRFDGGIETPEHQVETDAARIAAELRAELGAIPEMIIEQKRFSVALHYRNVPEAGPRVTEAARETLSHLSGWVGTSGKMVIEIRPQAFSKASAVRSFMMEPPFAGRVPVFVGDDTTDEDGMIAATELGGFGVKVGMGESVAQYRLADPKSVHGFLSCFLRS